MKFFKCAVFVIFAISMANLGASVYMYNDVCKKQENIEAKIQNLDGLKILHANSQTRESQLMQGILMIHHRLGIHQPGEQAMCPTCHQPQSPQRVALVEKEK